MITGKALLVSGTIVRMHGELSQKEKFIAFFAGIVVGLAVLAVALYQIPGIQSRVDWQMDKASAFVRGIVDPVKPIPTAIADASDVRGVEEGTLIPVLPHAALDNSPTPSPTSTQPEPTQVNTPTITPSPEPTLTPTAIPVQIELDPPPYEKQELNNCGPATLSMHLNYYNWGGTQTTISDVIKPLREDRNVNVEELAYYVNTQAAYYEIQYRVGGDIEMLKKLLAAGFPVTVEEAFIMEESYWMNDDRWAGHYLLLTGYNDATQRFTAQDPFLAPNISVPYSVLDDHWKAFNRVYIVLYPPEQRETVKSILGPHWDASYNRQHALEVSEREIELDSTDSYAWFNKGTNLVYFEKYSHAALAYDEARKHGFPQRMLRYQFGPFFAYFHTQRMDDLMAMTDYALKRTPNSEEALLWKGWGMYRQGKKNEALELFAQALEVRPNYPDAIYALEFARNN